MLRPLLNRARAAVRFLLIGAEPHLARYLRDVQASGLFDRQFYRSTNPGLNPLYRAFPERHYILFGEAEGRRPNPDFSPGGYLRNNPDLAGSAMPAFHHYVTIGRHEARWTRETPRVRGRTDIPAPVLRRAADAAPPKPQAVVAHVYYHDLWPEFDARLRSLDLEFDLFVTLTAIEGESGPLARRIRAAWPDAVVAEMPNHGRDIFPFVHLVNSGLLDPYRAIAKIHTKKSPHRLDGEDWRRHLIAGILPGAGTAALLERFLADPEAAFWVADGQHYTGREWWGSNHQGVADLLSRVEIRPDRAALSFPAGSMYWLKPLMRDMIRGLQLDQGSFEPENGQVDGTLAHGFERALGFIAAHAGQTVRQAGELARRAAAPAAPAAPVPAPVHAPVPVPASPGAAPADPATRTASCQGSAAERAPEQAPEPATVQGHTPEPGPVPAYVSAFYLPQFHPIPENDAWWGPGYTEWQAASRARPAFAGHAQPVLPGELGFYDLRLPQVMGAQYALAQQAGIDAFCVYHYWFDGRRVLQAPLDGLLAAPDIPFGFYLCWANESWRRNWDGLSGEVLLEQSYAAGFEAALARDCLPYMRDPRYARPDGVRPRFVIYRPGDMPDPGANLARLRAAWRDLGLGEVELGAVHFHVADSSPVDPGLFDFWIEMPPHGMVGDGDYLYGGKPGDRMGGTVDAARFRGVIYDYQAVIANSLAPAHRAALPARTIAGVMPSWDNTARRGPRAHIAHGANPASFARWLRALRAGRLAGSYRGELMINAWNEWAEKAMLEPSAQYGRANLDVLRDTLGKGR